MFDRTPEELHEESPFHQRNIVMSFKISEKEKEILKEAVRKSAFRTKSELMRYAIFSLIDYMEKES